MLHGCKRFAIHRTVGLLLAALTSADASAQSGRSDPVAAFPARPIRILVPSTPAGARDFLARLASFGFKPVGNTPAQFAAMIQSEMQKWEKLIKEELAQ